MTAPATTPCTMYFCTNRKKIIVGIDARQAAAIKLPQSVEYCCMNIWIPTGMVIVSGSRRKILAIRNSL